MSTSTTPLWRIVAAREISTQARSKAFQVSLGVMLLLVVGLIVLLTVLSGRETTHTVAVTGQDAAVVTQAKKVVAQIDDGDRLKSKKCDDAAAAEKAVRDGDADAALLRTDDGYEVVGDDEVDSTVGQALSTAATAYATQQNAAEQDVDLQAPSAGTAVSERLLDPGAENEGVRTVASLVFVMLFYITALGFGMQIAASVTSEKESRVVEILAAAVPIRALLWGKVVGSSVLAIAQTVLLVVVGVLALALTGNASTLGLLGPALAWYVVFFVIGFVALASLWSVAGSLASRQQDLQATTAPLQIVLFAPYIVAVTAGEGVKTIVSMLPIVSTMMMPSRLAEGSVPVWQLGVAIATTVLAAVLLVRLAARVYERTLLQTGRRITFSEALKIGN